MRKSVKDVMTPFSRRAAVALLIASPLGFISTVPAAALDGTVYNIARVTSHNFVETWTSLSGGTLHIRAVASNGDGGFLGRGPFAPVVTLAFVSQGRKIGEVKLLFNVPASQKDQTHEINIAGGGALWLQSDTIVASAANNLNARPPAGSWEAGFTYGGVVPIIVRPN
jgi:hypothetical protein